MIRVTEKMNQPHIPFIKTGCDLIKGIHRFEHKAMATMFEVLIHHDDAGYARQAAWEAFDELDRIEAVLSRFIENSDISRINNLPANQPLQIGLATFECLQLCSRVYSETDGAFDVTVGYLMDCWLNDDKTIASPSREDVNQARQHTGLHFITLDEDRHTLSLLNSPIRIDFGGVGKGYAVDQMAKLLREWSIDSALIHGGCSSVLALDPPPGRKGWPLTLSSPSDRKKILASLDLHNRALSGSGLQKGPHILNPRTGRPVEGKHAAWACTTDAATADALSTAFIVMSSDEVEKYCLSHRDVLAMLVTEEEGKEERILRFGHWKEDGLNCF